MEIKNNSISRQFETLTSNGILSVEYSLQEKKLFLTKLIIPEAFLNFDFIDNFIEQILIQAESKNYKVVPTSPKIAAFFKKFPKYKFLLPPGIRL